MKEKLYIVKENGEIVDKIDSDDKYVKLSEGDKIVRRGVLQYLSQTVDIKYLFIKINPEIYGDLANKYSMLNKLVKYIGYMDGILQYNNGKNIQIKDLPKICSLSETTVKRQLQQLTREDVIHKVKDGKKRYLVINPWVCCRGRKIYLSLYEEFKLSQWRFKCEEYQKK